MGELILAPQGTILGTVIVLLGTGIFYTLYTSNTNAIVQLAAPGHMQGRVAGLYSYIFAGSSPFGAVLVGWLAEQGGTQLAFLVAGATAVICALFATVARMRLRQSPEGCSAKGCVAGGRPTLTRAD